MKRLAVASELPGGTRGVRVGGTRDLAVRLADVEIENAARGWEKIVRERDRTWILSRSGVPPGGLKDTARCNSEPLLRWRLAVRVIPPGGTCSEGNFVVLCAWRYATPARRSGSWQRLASFGALKVGLLVFLELWLGTYPLSCGSG
ncbi:hypothetical protein DEO72_LG6g582 [Vigna unguiculata]|uniref:Uncharacterized protein n=1 Tax=Vigna unguiculata TaxID=3917 RepID=A0A4D6M404_VIGUN|nr:hypothetical protein DEO72_LG6g582 [Vigna unguiculata]